MRKRVSSVISIRAAAPEPNVPPDQPPASAALVPPLPVAASRRRRTDRVVRMVPHGNRSEAEAIENADISTQIRFLAATCDDICSRFVRGVSESEIARTLGGRSYNVARVDVEDVIRRGYREERAARIMAERQLRVKAA